MQKIYFHLLLVLFVFLSSTVLAGEHEEPPHKMIEGAFFKCDESRNLEGGIYGKGPFKRFGPKKSKCSKTEWVKITRDEFKQLAAAWYLYDWKKEKDMPFWSSKK